jgi:hypothetical protein
MSTEPLIQEWPHSRALRDQKRPGIKLFPSEKEAVAYADEKWPCERA